MQYCLMLQTLGGGGQGLEQSWGKGVGTKQEATCINQNLVSATCKVNRVASRRHTFQNSTTACRLAAVQALQQRKLAPLWACRRPP
jgi:hypothetical protein